MNKLCEFLKFFSPLTVVVIICVIVASYCDKHDPKITLDVRSITLHEFNVSSSSSSSSQTLTANWDIQFSTENTYDSTLIYENIQTCVVFKNQTIACTSIKSFLQGIGKTNLVEANIVANSQRINPTLADDLVAERTTNGSLTWSLYFNSTFALIDEKASHTVLLSCPDFKLVFSSNLDMATLLDPPISCTY